MTRLSPKLNLPDRIYIDDAVRAVSDLVSETLNNVGSAVSEIAAYLSEAQGKGVRTLVLLNSAVDSEGYVPSEAVKASAAIEIFHLATLVHDDIIDDADVRRGIPSIQKKFGKKQAVIAGDYLLCIAFSAISDIYGTYTDFMPDFSKAVSHVCLGELSQYKNNGNLDLSIWEYFKIISGKTAALFYLSAYAGALIGGADKKDAKAIARYGQYLGMVFQIIDDCKDYELTEKDALKTVGSDMLAGVVTLPLVIALSKDIHLKGIIKDIMGGGSGDVASAIATVRSLGGTDGSRKIALKYCNKAQAILSKITNIRKKDALSALLTKAYEAANQF